MDLARFGVWVNSRALSDPEVAERARAAEDLGFGTIWLGGSPRPEALRPALDATKTIQAATGIVDIWQNGAAAVAAESAAIERDYPGRSLIGLGVGHPQADPGYARPRRAMQGYLDALDTGSDLPAGRRVLAALGPAMLDLAKDRSQGAHTFFTVAGHARFARERLGSGPLIAPQVPCVLDVDVARARATASEYAAFYLRLPNFTNNLLSFGFNEADFAEGGSDRLLDTVIPHGSAEEIAASVNAHFNAGASHVCLTALGAEGTPLKEWAALASALNI